MRLLLVVVALGACTVYDPVDEVPHHEVAGARAAMQLILDEVGDAKVYAIGEYHPSRKHAGKRSPLQRFTSEIVDLLVPRAQHLVLETWSPDACGRAVTAEVAQTLGRPASTTTDMEALKMRSALARLQTHGLPITCIEHDSLLDGAGRVDFLRLLLLVTDKLAETTRRLAAGDRAVIVYGGALHNDLYPRWPLEDLSYAHVLDRELPGGVVEVDLVVPEVVAPMPLIRNEPWFPLLGRATPERTLVWQRGPRSYVVILPAADYETRKVALPVASL